MISLLNNSLVMSMVIIILIIFNALLGKKYPSKWRYYAWFIIVIGLIIPFRPGFDVSITKIKAPINIELNSNSTLIDDHLNSLITLKETPVSKIPEFDPILIIFLIWIFGVIGKLSYYIYKYKKFMITVKRWSYAASDASILEIFNKAKADLNIKTNNIYVKVCKFAISPMLIKLINPIILLPEKEIHLDDLEFIFLHEFTHFKRKDLWAKMLVLFAITLNWFNPLVYIMANMIYEDCESSCDEAIVFGRDFEARKQYGESIISTISKISNPILLTYFYNNKKRIKKRLFSILDMNKKQFPIAILSIMIVTLTTIFSNNVFAKAENSIINTNDAYSVLNIISIEEAKDIALLKTSGGEIVEIKLENDDELICYEIEIVKGNLKYNIIIGATDSRIYEFETENDDDALNVENLLPFEKIKEIALNKTKDGIISKFELDFEDGKYIYEVKIINGNSKYDMHIDAVNGSFIYFIKIN